MNKRNASINPTKPLPDTTIATSVRAPRAMKDTVLDLTPGKVYACKPGYGSLYTIKDDVGYERRIRVGYNSYCLKGRQFTIVATRQVVRHG